MRYLRNAWYQFAWSGEIVENQSLSREMLDDHIVVWRDPDGQLGALIDRCPHRFAPLSAGRVTGGLIVCGYHGLAFGRTGSCLHNPHGPVTANMRVKNFAVVEKHDAIWVWMGEEILAEPELIPDLSFIDQTPPVARIQETMWNAANFQLLADNVLDLSHIDYIHPETLGRMMTAAKTQTTTTEQEVVVEWAATGATTPMGYKMIVPEGPCDVWMKVVWRAPALLRLDVAVTAAGVPYTEADVMSSVHNFTPASEKSTHYFLCSVRHFALDDVKVTEHLRSALMQAFLTEDKPMIEKQQARMGTSDLWALKPTLLATDAGAVQARRKLERLIATESEMADMAAE